MYSALWNNRMDSLIWAQDTEVAAFLPGTHALRVSMGWMARAGVLTIWRDSNWQMLPPV